MNEKEKTITYSVFSGIEVSIIDIKASGFFPAPHRDRNIIEINHCLEGRMECQMNDGCLQYIGEGDVFLNTLNNHSSYIDIPLGYYKGLVITIDTYQGMHEIVSQLMDIHFDISELMNRFFARDECFLIQSKDEVQRLFLDMYDIPEEARGVYFQLKILQILIYLHYFDTSKEIQKGVFTRQQIDIAKKIEKQMTENPDKRYTIDELAQKHCISPTSLKSYFKEVYGKPIATYMKEYRIQYAAKLLRETDENITSIALAVGYESQSKFGETFKGIMKLTPMKYRMKYK